MKLTTNLSKFLYKMVFKRLFFALDPEFIHDTVTLFGRFLGSNFLTRKLVNLSFAFEDSSLSQNILGINLKNPIGLAAGFDKNAHLLKVLPEVGFGFAEVGSITGEACPGNSGTRLWRMPNSESLLVYYGLKNDGAVAISQRLSGKKYKFPVGISIAKTNSKDTVEEHAGIEDYFKAYKEFVSKNIGDYFTINISCPNAYGGEPFVEPEKLDHLLSRLRQIENAKPVFIKLPPELPFIQIDRIIEVANLYKIDGYICTNLAKSRSNEKIKDNAVPEVGGFSGKVVQELSDNLVAYIYRKTNGQSIIIGCGGVFNAEDAYKKIRLGANLIQMITGMIYNGPQVIGEINRGLSELLKRDGFKNISEAVGVDNKLN